MALSGRWRQKDDGTRMERSLGGKKPREPARRSKLSISNKRLRREGVGQAWPGKKGGACGAEGSNQESVVVMCVRRALTAVGTHGARRHGLIK